MDNPEIWWAAEALKSASAMELMWFQMGTLFVIYGLTMGMGWDEAMALSAEKNPNGAELSRRMLAWHERFMEGEPHGDQNEQGLVGKGA